MCVGGGGFWVAWGGLADRCVCVVCVWVGVLGSMGWFGGPVCLCVVCVLGGGGAG